MYREVGIASLPAVSLLETGEFTPRQGGQREALACWVHLVLTWLLAKSCYFLSCWVAWEDPVAAGLAYPG